MDFFKYLILLILFSAPCFGNEDAGIVNKSNVDDVLKEEIEDAIRLYFSAHKKGDFSALEKVVSKEYIGVGKKKERLKSMIKVTKKYYDHIEIGRVIVVESRHDRIFARYTLKYSSGEEEGINYDTTWLLMTKPEDGRWVVHSLHQDFTPEQKEYVGSGGRGE